MRCGKDVEAEGDVGRGKDVVTVDCYLTELKGEMGLRCWSRFFGNGRRIINVWVIGGVGKWNGLKED